MTPVVRQLMACDRGANTQCNAQGCNLHLFAFPVCMPMCHRTSSYVVSRHSLYGNKCYHWRHIYGANDPPYPHRAFAKSTVSADPPGRSPRARAPWTL